MRLGERLYLICENGIRIIGGLVLVFLLITNFLFSSYVDYQSERVHIEKNGISVFFTMLFLLGAVFAVSRMVEKINENILFGVLTVIFLSAGIYFIGNTDGILRSDPLYVYQTAAELEAGNYSSFAKDGYLYYFPHQLGLATYERMLRFFSDDTKFLFYCNLLEVTGINFFLWRLTNRLFKCSHAVNINVIIFSFAFLPQFFFILFAYGLIPGLFCLIAAFYWAAAFVDSEKKRYLVAMILFSCLAVFLKKNYLVGMIALAIWLFLELMKSRKYRGTFAALLLVPCCILSVKAVQSTYELRNHVRMGEGVPAALYIGMGVNINNEVLGPGWFDGTNWSYFTQCDQDSQAAAELAKNMLQIYWGQMREEPFRTVKFFVKKSVSIWCEPMFQSVWSGPLEWCEQYMNTSFLQSLYRGEKVEHAVYQYMKGYILILLSTSFLFLVKGWKECKGASLFLLYNTGGFLFHIFWEGKSQYIYPYMFMLIPLSAYMLAGLFTCKKSKT